jgi:3-hydroxy-9,10-secoandrosta-1,3,5(10)-triene-9,17-dione monooxygenase
LIDHATPKANCASKKRNIQEAEVHSMQQAAEREGSNAGTLAAIMDRVRALLPAIRERAPGAEDGRAIPLESAQDFLDAGLARILVPKRFGGLELGIQAWVDLAAEVAAADASHGWCASLMMHHPHYLAQFPDAAQRAVWANGPDVAIAATLTPTSKVEIVDGGYKVVSSAIPYLSGINHSSWVVVSGMVAASGDGPPTWTMFLIPPGKFRIEDTWDTVGMRGTGSHTVIVENVFVPADHTNKVQDMLLATTPGATLSKTPFYDTPWVTYGPLTFLGPMLGAARGALETYRSWTEKRSSLFGAAVAEYASIQVNFGRTEADLDAADLLMRRCAQVAESDHRKDERLRARCYRDHVRSSELIVGAVDTIMRIGGAAVYARSNGIQRAWRDVHFASSHVVLNPEVGFATWGRHAFKLPRDPKQVLY